MIQITDEAKDKIQDLLSRNSGKYLRVFIKGMGWSGPSFGMALDEPEEKEQTVQVDGLDFLIADFAMPFMDGSTIDYIKLPDSEGFIITRSESCC